MRLVSRILTSRRNRRLRGTIDSQTEENSDQRKLLIRENYYGRILKPNHNRVSCFPKFEPITRLTFYHKYLCITQEYFPSEKGKDE
eukprot:COSAG02_NODE_1460_length_12494_cov_126.207422_2_plen_86_part_00